MTGQNFNSIDRASDSEQAMTLDSKSDRRGFLGRVVGAAAAVSVPLATGEAAVLGSTSEDWIREVKGTHRCLFDFPQHKGGFPLLHILNFLSTYSTGYHVAAGQVGAVGTFYAMGPQGSISLAFNDAMWKKYALGEYTGLKDAEGIPYTRNVFAHPTTDDLHVMMEAVQSPVIPAIGAIMPAIGIENLQKMGAKFLLCAIALGVWSMELEARGKGNAQDIEKDLRANVLPGVTIVPAMVIAIEKAQEAGIRYNRQ